MSTETKAVVPGDTGLTNGLAEAQLQTFIAEWQAAQGHKEKARIENRIWVLRQTGAKPLPRMRDYLCSLLGGGTSIFDIRASLWGLGMDSLWERISKSEMSVSTASKVIRDARLLAAREGITHQAAVLRVLAEYDTWPARSLPGGGTVRFRPAASFSQSGHRKIRDESDFFQNIRHLLNGYVLNRLQGADPMLVESLVSEFARDLRVLTDGWSSKLTRARAQTASAVVFVKYAKVVDACQTLGMDPPKKGMRVNMAAARSKKKALARAYHPDVSPNTREQYETVMAAFATLEEYDEMFKSTQSSINPKQANG